MPGIRQRNERRAKKSTKSFIDGSIAVKRFQAVARALPTYNLKNKINIVGSDERIMLVAYPCSMLISNTTPCSLRGSS